VLFWTVAASPASIFLLLSLFFFRKAAICSTAYLGSYFFVRGITLYTGYGGTYNDKVFSPLNFISHWRFNQVTPHFYLCFAMIYVCTIGAAIWQYCSLKRYKDKRKQMIFDRD